jgi:hypothetical protein
MGPESTLFTNGLVIDGLGGHADFGGQTDVDRHRRHATSTSA